MDNHIKLIDQKDTKFKRRQLRQNMTKAERLIWHMVRNKQLGYKFKRQCGIGRYVVDFYCPSLNLIVEIDGGIHGEVERKYRDNGRQRYFQQFRFIIKRYHNDQILDSPEGVYYDLKSFCDNLSSLKPPSNSPLEGGRKGRGLI